MPQIPTENAQILTDLTSDVKNIGTCSTSKQNVESKILYPSAFASGASTIPIRSFRLAEDRKEESHRYENMDEESSSTHGQDLDNIQKIFSAIRHKLAEEDESEESMFSVN